MRLATLAIVVDGDRVLLGLKKTGEIGTNTINAPGGKHKAGETLPECAARETLEEVGIKLQPERLDEIAVILFHARGVPTFKVHVFWTDAYEGEPFETRDMIPAWYPIERLPLSRMLQSDRAWFGFACSRTRFRAHVFYRDSAADFEGIVLALEGVEHPAIRM